MVTTFAGYTTAPFYPGCDPPGELKRFVAIVAILFISIINGLSVKASQVMTPFFSFIFFKTKKNQTKNKEIKKYYNISD